MRNKTDIVIIGAGQAGLAMSNRLSRLGIDHRVIERGRIAQRWRAERWDSLRLLTPNWMTRLPGWSYTGTDPDGFMGKDALCGYLQDYAQDFGAPVLEETTVLSVRPYMGGYKVDTDQSNWCCRAVVVATGACDRPHVPGWATDIDPSIVQITPESYKRPADITPGGVLVAGASATGIQLAEELARAGHDVTLAAGSHVRIPRRYRGRDVMHWLDASGFLTDRRAPGADPARILRQPSLQLVGGATHRTINLDTVARAGVEITGRITGAAGGTLRTDGRLAEEMTAADARCRRVLGLIDDHILRQDIDAPEDTAPWHPLPPMRGGDQSIDLHARGIRTILWATGYRRAYPWLNLPILDPGGEIRQEGGICPVPGLYVLGLPFMRRRNSTFIDGVGQDASDLCHTIMAHLDRPRAEAA